MKYILIFLIIISFADAKKKEKDPYSRGMPKYKELMYSPYKTNLIIEYLNSGYKDKKILRELFYITNNNIIREKLSEKLNHKDLYDKGGYAKLFKLLDQKKLDEIIDTYKKIEKKGATKKSNIYAIKASIIKEEDIFLYREYFNKGWYYSKNEYLFYYLLYKGSFIKEDYLSAYDYLELIYREDYYKYIEEDLLDVCIKAAEKEFKNKNYFVSWLMSAKGIEYTKKVNYNRNIKRVIKIKDLLFTSSQHILNNNNKNKDKNLYIIRKTREYLTGEKK